MILTQGAALCCDLSAFQAGKVITHMLHAPCFLPSASCLLPTELPLPLPLLLLKTSSPIPFSKRRRGVCRVEMEY